MRGEEMSNQTMYAEKGAELLRELMRGDRDGLPPFQDKLVREIVQEIHVHQEVIHATDAVKGGGGKGGQARGAEEAEEAPSTSGAGAGGMEGGGGGDGGDGDDEDDDDGGMYPLPTATGLLIRHQSILRNKQCLLAYVNERMRRIKGLRWTIGAKLPEHIEANMSPSERQFFSDYDANLRQYIGDISVETDLDLTVDMLPPKDPWIEVRVLEDAGREIATEHSGVRNFRKNTMHFLDRRDAEPLINQGILEHYAPN